MKQQIELTCATCGEKFTAEADYILEGIQGFVINSKGERVEFVDPTAEHHCDECLREMVGPLWRSVDGKKEDSDGYLDALKEKYGVQVKLPIGRTYQERSKCYGCLFNGVYQDMGASTPICDREPDLLKAFKAHSSKDKCKYYITRAEIIALQNAILQEDKSDST